jgi:2,4-dienoyl-CoA reductase-like NADH-dependent reductase (Old Yellow Enzyme family)
MSRLFSPLHLRNVAFRNRIFVSPMCQYSAVEGLPTDWHLVHLGSRAVGGAALVLTEATAVTPEGRISPEDLGIWNDNQAEGLSRICAFVEAQGAVPGIQLAHAGRKGSTAPPWKGGRPLRPGEGGWNTVAPSPLPFSPDHPPPHELSQEEIGGIVGSFAAAARRASEAGFRVVELHMAHGYLLHEFLSPLSNRRRDRFGGSLEGRMRLPLLIVEAVRAAVPEALPLFVRISATDWVDGGLDLEQSAELCARMRDAGVDLIDVSSGGLVPHARIPAAPGYQVPFSAAIRRSCEVATAAVGLITDPLQAEEIVASGSADAVLLARQLLREPYWPLRAAAALGAQAPWPKQYERAK